MAVLGFRIAYGAGLLVAPGRLTRRWLGPAAADPGTQVVARGLGAREIAVHAGALHAALGGGALRRWLAASVAGDLADIAATTGARDGLPERSATRTLVVAGASALVTVAVMITAPRDPLGRS